MSRVLISGGAGFIGSHLCDHFIEAGWDVVCVDNLITGSRQNIQQALSSPRFTFIEQAVEEFTWPPDVPIDRIFHLASPASPPQYLKHPIETLMVGAVGTQRLLELARVHGARFLLASTSEVYGDPLEHPQAESYWGHVNPCGERSCYDESKRFAEAMTMAYHRTHGVDTRIARIFNTYGPRMAYEDGRVVPNFIAQSLEGRPLTIYGDGQQTRSFCFYSDLVRGLVALMEKGDTGPTNLGNPVEFTMLELANLVQELAQQQLPLERRPLPSDDPKQRQPVIERARTMLGWEPQVPLRVGLSETMEWFRARRATTSPR